MASAAKYQHIKSRLPTVREHINFIALCMIGLPEYTLLLALTHMASHRMLKSGLCTDM